LDERKKKRKAGEKDNAETRRTLRSAEKRKNAYERPGAQRGKSGELRQGVWRANGEVYETLVVWWNMAIIARKGRGRCEA
jgi:hypothetical protein